MQDYNGGRTLDDFVKFLEPEGAADVSTFPGLSISRKISMISDSNFYVQDSEDAEEAADHDEL